MGPLRAQQCLSGETTAYGPHVNQDRGEDNAVLRAYNVSVSDFCGSMKYRMSGGL